MKTINYLSKPLNKHGFAEGRQDYCLEDTVWLRQKYQYRIFTTWYPCDKQAKGLADELLVTVGVLEVNTIIITQRRAKEHTQSVDRLRT